MSTAAVITSLSKEVAAISAGLARVEMRVDLPWSASYLSAARGHLAQANLAMTIALRAGVDPVIEAAA